jgi:hypothetical protein
MLQQLSDKDIRYFAELAYPQQRRFTIGIAIMCTKPQSYRLLVMLIRFWKAIRIR